MKNIYFPDEDITENDVYFVCYMIERVARKIHQRNKYVVGKIGHDNLARYLSNAPVLHCENPLQVVDDICDEFSLAVGDFDITNVDRELCPNIPTELEIGKVYTRLIMSTLQPDENYAAAIIRIYNSPICEIIDNYNCSAYYEPSYVVEKAYYNNGF